MFFELMLADRVKEQLLLSRWSDLSLCVVWRPRPRHPIPAALCYRHH